jgi:hypothetical protein
LRFIQPPHIPLNKCLWGQVAHRLAWSFTRADADFRPIRRASPGYLPARPNPGEINQGKLPNPELIGHLSIRYWTPADEGDEEGP